MNEPPPPGGTDVVKTSVLRQQQEVSSSRYRGMISPRRFFRACESDGEPWWQGDSEAGVDGAASCHFATLTS